MKLSERYAHLLENFDKLPDDAVIPTAVTAALLSVNPKTIVCRTSKASRFRRVARHSAIFVQN